MRPHTLHFFHASGTTKPSLTLERGGICRHIIHVVLFGAMSGWGVCCVRLKAEVLDPISNTVNDQETDILSIVPFLEATHMVSQQRQIDVNFRLDDKQKIYGTMQLLSGGPSNIHQYVTLWLEDFPRGSSPEEQVPGSLPGIRDPGRSFNLEAARRLLGTRPDGSILDRPQKPSH